MKISLVKYLLLAVALATATKLHAQLPDAGPNDGGMVIVTYPPPFPPEIPVLGPDDDHIYYHYQALGTGWWTGDPDFFVSNFASGTTESYVRHKTNNTTTSVFKNQIAWGYFYTLWGICAEVPGVHLPGGTTIVGEAGICQSADANAPCSSPIGGPGWYTSPTGTDLGGNIYGTDIVSYTNISVDCGTLTLGESYFQYTWGEVGGGYCGKTPTLYPMGNGFLHEINLTITTNCTANSTNATLLPPNDVAIFVQGTNNFTLDQASFVSNNFQFVLNGRSNVQYAIDFSTNLIDWSQVTNITLSSTSGLCSINISPSTTLGFFRAHDTGPCPTECTEPVGFHKRSLQTGWNMIANQFLNPTNMKISTVLGSVPNASILQFWGITNWGAATTFSSGNWDHPNWMLIPGRGARIYVPTNTVVDFIGKVFYGNIKNVVPSGYSVYSSVIPQAGNRGTSFGEYIYSLALPPLNTGDTIQKWTGSNYLTYTKTSTGWSPGYPYPPLRIEPGESVIVNAASPVNWHRTFYTSDVLALKKPAFDWDGDNHAGWLSVYWTSACGFVPRTNAVWEVYDYSGGLLMHQAPVSQDGDITDETQQTIFIWPDDYVLPQGGCIKVRYRNGDSYSPFSDMICL
jgi:hypothetical protein